ncbi:hypothetical protein PWT90_10803 [Aphanocladium album]|nr:hypothetical protein PWT90_10803 [Aphanocladium album]
MTWGHGLPLHLFALSRRISATATREPSGRGGVENCPWSNSGGSGGSGGLCARVGSRESALTVTRLSYSGASWRRPRARLKSFAASSVGGGGHATVTRQAEVAVGSSQATFPFAIITSHHALKQFRNPYPAVFAQAIDAAKHAIRTNPLRHAAPGLSLHLESLTSSSQPAPAPPQLQAQQAVNASTDTAATRLSQTTACRQGIPDIYDLIPPAQIRYLNSFSSPSLSLPIRHSAAVAIDASQPSQDE